jgi:hypothetical protein
MVTRRLRERYSRLGVGIKQATKNLEYLKSHAEM